MVSLGRYPIMSRLGEELHAAQVHNHGLLGDRAYAILDSADGKVATAKSPRKRSRMHGTADFQRGNVSPEIAL